MSEVAVKPLNINFPRSPKLVRIDTHNMMLHGYFGKKHLTQSQLNLDPDTDIELVKEVIEEFRMSINAPLKGKTKK